MSNIAIVLILIISVITDLRSRKILNIVTLPAILAAFIYQIFTSGLDGFLFSGKGFLVGLGLLLIPFLMGGIGAGDVKLLASIGAWKGAMFVLYTAVYAGIIGGLISIVILLKDGRLGSTLKGMLLSFMFLREVKGSLQIPTDGKSSISIPYAVPIAFGSLMTFLMEAFL